MTTTALRKRSPHGVDSNPIALRLMPEERTQAEDISKQLGLSKATFARLAYLAGIPLVVASQSKPTGDHDETSKD